MQTINWRFPPLSGGTRQGYTNNDIEAFKGEELMDNLAREVCQNSLDAKVPTIDAPVRVVFELKQIPTAAYAVFSEYKTCIDGCRRYWGDSMDSKLSRFLDDAEEMLARPTIPVLVAGDYNMPLIIVLFPMLTMYDSNRNANPLCVVNSIFSSTWSSIENSNDPCCVVHHPLVADLKTASGVLGADIANQVCPFKDGTILFLYSSTPTILKAIERTGAYQFDALTFSPDFQDNFCRPQVYPSRHAGNENRHVIGDCKSDFLFQFPFYYTCIRRSPTATDAELNGRRAVCKRPPQNAVHIEQTYT